MINTSFKDIKFNGTYWRRHVNTANNIYWYVSIIQDNAKSYTLGALRYHYNINNNTWYLSNYIQGEPSVIIDYIPDVEVFYLKNYKELNNKKTIEDIGIKRLYTFSHDVYNARLEGMFVAARVDLKNAIGKTITINKDVIELEEHMFNELIVSNLVIESLLEATNNEFNFGTICGYNPLEYIRE